MRRALKGIGVVVFVWVLTQGCGGGGGGGSPEPVGEFSADYVAALCHRILACCSNSEIAALDPTIVDQASCEAGLVPSSGSDLVIGPALVEAGATTYHGDTARACLDGVAALPCGAWGGPVDPPPVPQCNEVFVGMLMPGSSCGDDLQCASNSCRGDSAGGVTCAQAVMLGASCEFAPCVSGLACVSSPSGGPRTCGQALVDGSPCSYNQDCTSRLCMMDATGQGTCSHATSCQGR